MCSSPVSASVTGTGRPSTVTVGAVCASFCSAQACSSASVVPFPSNVLHSNEDAATKILVPGFTVHDGTPLGLGLNGATVPPRFQHANAPPPVPNEFWADGVWSTVVHNAARLALSFVTVAALAAGAARPSVTAASNGRTTRRKILTTWCAIRLGTSSPGLVV